MGLTYEDEIGALVATPAKPSEKQLDDRLREMEARLAISERRLAALEARTGTVPVAPTVTPAAAGTAEPATPTFAPGAEPARGRDLERTIGANVLAKVGMVVLVLGVVFFINYAFQQGWITIPMRIVLGVAGGLVLAVGGDLLRRWDRDRFGAYGQVLAGGGAAIIFFSLFAAYQFSEYRAATGMTLELDAFLLGSAALALGLYATWARTPVLAVEAVALGLLASLFGERFGIFSVSYTLLLTGGVVAAAAWRRWIYVLVAGAVSGFVNLALLQAFNVDDTHLLVGAFLLGALLTLAAFLQEVPQARDQDLMPILTGGTWLATWGLALWSFDDLGLLDQPMGFLTAGFAAGAFALASLRIATPGARWGWAVAGIVTALAWPPIHFDGVPTAIAWAGLVAAGAAVLFARDHIAIRGGILAASVLLTLHLFLDETRKINEDTLDEAIGLVPYSAAVLVGVGAWIVAGLRGSREEPMMRVVLGLSLVPPLYYTTAALEGFVVSIAWTLEAVAVVVCGFVLGIRDLRVAALALFGVVLMRIFFVDLLKLDLAVRIITFLVVGGLLLLASFLYARRQKMPSTPLKDDAAPAAPKAATNRGPR